MSRLDEALERLERAVAQLEAACGGETRAVRRATEAQGEPTLRVAAGEIAARVDGALARISQVIGGED
jgi:hypothetical protein